MIDTDKARRLAQLIRCTTCTSCCTTTGHVLDWIAQIASKRWALEEPACIGEFVVALDTLFHLQATLCPFGQARRIDATAILTARARELGLAAGTSA